MGKKPMGVIQTRLTTIDLEENKIEIYRSADGKVELNVKLEKDTVWLTQNQMAELFGVDRTSIVRHIRNIIRQRSWMRSQPVQKMHRFVLRVAER